MKNQARVVVIGGGMMGVGLALHLGEEGWSDTILVEKGDLTSGSTWHAAGQVPSFVGNYAMAQMHHYAIGLYPKLETLSGQSATWHGCGSIRFALKQEDVDWFHHVAAFAPTIGMDVEVIDVDKVRDLNPFLTTDGVVGAVWTPQDGHVDPSGACNAMARLARNYGVAIETKCQVLDIRGLPSGDWCVETTHGEIRCEHVVNAAGCYAQEIMRMIRPDDANRLCPITNCEHQYLVTDTILEFAERSEEIPVLRDPWTSGYIRQEQNSGLIGIYEEDAIEAWNFRGGTPLWESESELFAENLDHISDYIERAMNRMPIFAEAGIKRVYNGAISHSPDGNPLVGPASELQNFWMCCGSSFGVTQGAGCGKYLAQWMVHGDSDINMASVDPRRFGDFATNDWVREMSFQDYRDTYISGIPGEERPAARNARLSGLHDRLAAHGAVFGSVFGWERPKYFAADGKPEVPSFRRNHVFQAVEAEHRAVREAAGLMDLSSFAKFVVEGEGARDHLCSIYAGKIPAKVGGIALCHRLGSNGRIQGESTIARIDETKYVLFSGAAWEVRDFDALQAHKPNDVTLKNYTTLFNGLLLAGPKSRDILGRLTNTALDNASFPWMTAQTLDVAGANCMALRLNYAGALGWELYCPADTIGALYDAIWEAGGNYGLTNFGSYALNSLRMEKAYKGLGSELTNEITPEEAGIMRFISSKRNFSGRDALKKSLKTGGRGRIIYCEVDATDTDVVGGEAVFVDNKAVGIATSGGYGFSVDKSLAFAYIDMTHIEPNMKLEIDLLGVRRSARILQDPAFDPENKVPRG